MRPSAAEATFSSSTGNARGACDTGRDSRCRESSTAEAWAYWAYLPSLRRGSIAESAAASVRGKASDYHAGARYVKDTALGVAWSVCDDSEVAAPSSCASFFPHSRRSCNWIDLIYDKVALRRYLALSIEGQVSLPAPQAEKRDGDDSPTLWVPRDKYIIVRLANMLDPSCSDFDAWFERSGILVR